MAGRGQRASFGSFRIAIILRLWATVLTVENCVCMVNKPMVLFDKRFLPKAPSAASLSPGQFVDRPGTGCDFLPAPYCDTVSKGGMGGLVILEFSQPLIIQSEVVPDFVDHDLFDFLFDLLLRLTHRLDRDLEECDLIRKDIPVVKPSSI